MRSYEWWKDGDGEWQPVYSYTHPGRRGDWVVEVFDYEDGRVALGRGATINQARSRAGLEPR